MTAEDIIGARLRVVVENQGARVVAIDSDLRDAIVGMLAEIAQLPRGARVFVHVEAPTTSVEEVFTVREPISFNELEFHRGGDA